MDAIDGWTSLTDGINGRHFLMDVINGWQWTALMDGINGRH
jgi:hypothetical protein